MSERVRTCPDSGWKMKAKRSYRLGAGKAENRSCINRCLTENLALHYKRVLYVVGVPHGGERPRAATSRATQVGATTRIPGTLPRQAESDALGIEPVVVSGSVEVRPAAVSC
jgi:hypothetical protein